MQNLGVMRKRIWRVLLGAVLMLGAIDRLARQARSHWPGLSTPQRSFTTGPCSWWGGFNGATTL